MFLTRLESIGFKSFAERIKIDFVDGVTAVVGPNGSGKSNVIDAVRWVLGEQSAKSLRGQKMEDIIFQGSDSRQALNFAEVSLVLDNTRQQLPIDYQEVNITRRVYRNGESEFFINKEVCRLKDIVDLFTDTGLGRSSFSIIGQGKIDEILSSKAEDRRAIFEEAAGVLKYKQRKKKAEFKLLDTQDNLDRVEDIRHEVNTQLNPLKKQAEKAKSHQNLSKKLKEIEVSLLVTEIELAHQAWEKLLHDMDTIKMEVFTEETTLQKKEASVEKVRHDITYLESEIETLQGKLVATIQKIEQKEGQRNVLTTQMTHAKETEFKLAEDKKQLEMLLTKVTKSMRDTKQQLTQIDTSLESIKAQILKFEKHIHRSPKEIEKEIDSFKSKYIDKLNEQAALNNEIKRDEKLDGKLNEQHAYYHQQSEMIAVNIEKLNYEEKKLKQQLEQAKDRSQSKQTSNLKTKENFETVQKELREMHDKLYQGKEMIAKISSKIEMLEDMKDNYQGFFYGAKSILHASKKGEVKDVQGSVIENIDIPPKYVDAMETILGHQAQHIVTKDSLSARHAIEWLKSHQKGRATFLPLNVLKPKFIPEAILRRVKEIEGYVDIAANLIKVKEHNTSLASYLLGNVLVTTDLKSAHQVATQTGRKYRIVTLQGDVVFPGGSMSGGSKQENKTSLFTREKELKVLRKKLQAFTERKERYEALITSKSEQFETLKRTIQNEETKMNQFNEKMAPIEDALQKVKFEIDHLNQKKQLFIQDKNEKKEELTNLKEKLNQLFIEKKAIKNKLEHYEAKINDLTEEKSTQVDNEQENLQIIHELTIKKAEHEERQRATEEKYTALQAQIDEYQTNLKNINHELNRIYAKEKQAEQKEKIDTELTTLKSQKETIEKEIQTAQTHRQEMYQGITDEESNMKGLKNKINQIKNQIQTKEVQANRMDVNLENQLNYLQNQYKITFERAKNEYNKVDDLKNAQSIVDTLKSQMERLGTVNMGAIEEYERLNARHEFLTQQQTDLEQAKDTLYAIIEEMDHEMIKRFNDVFVQIQAAFTEVFKHLFGGGFAELKLTDPNHLLDTGIEIVAQPPGKKLKTLDLLSGGERALTAIALLFAILHVKPVPFCILDEVDAALDESNVNRFGKYLKEFSQQTQFIVITHRKGTMEEADVLYGITMQESGVSRLVSVKLEETASLTESV